ncbi:hypothetical protein FOCC_FOCC001103 [Frankliniella occidentalis]|uniref:Uncharacterized protein LOC113212284 n=1 Tax=Frankliniella occidentalis TaxID=133901 RepID=A0A6J1T500_FRAOC|nr:uncharacterized protein LOC113212284 [Frankliniella occidentalis]KAE8752310.1 hypothetical protein FOCC_FOCC001103 [Frankliniella occidentalis]
MESDDEEKMSARDMRALSSYLRDEDAEDDVGDILNTSALTLGSQQDRANLVLGPSSLPMKRPRHDSEGEQQSSQTFRISDVEVPAVADIHIPEVLTPLPAPPIPERLVGQQISYPHQSVHNPQSSCQQERSSTPVPCPTIKRVQESCLERIPSSSLGFVPSVQQDNASGDENQILCDDILAHTSFRIEEESLFGEEYFWDYRDVEDNFQLTKPPGPHFIQEEIIEEDEAHDEPTAGCDQGIPIYPGASINMLESLTSILSFVQSEKISGVGLGRLLSLIDLHLPQPNNFYKSSHSVSKMLETLDEPVLMHYFCSVCYKTRVSLSDLCDSCTDPARYVHYFLTFPLAAQLSRFLMRPEFVQNLQHKLTRDKQNPENIEDIYDGEIYMQTEAQNVTVNGISITLMWNTDGVQIFKSNTYSLWPVYMVVNELPPEKRFLSENLLIAGLWGSLVKPHPNVYLLPIYKDLVPLQNGVLMDVCGESEKQRVVVKTVCGTCDAPATSLFMNMKGHAGFYSCPICFIKGEKPGDATVFPYAEDVPLRDLQSYKNHVKLAVQNRILLMSTVRNEERYCGIKGPTILSDMLDNMFSMMSIDSMHCIYLGLMRQMLRLWFDKDFKHLPFSSHVQSSTISARLLSLTPPHFLQRLHQPVEKLVHWKASEFRSFLFYVSLVLLQGVLKPHVYNHFALFVKGVALLNSSSISPSDIVTAGTLLRQFVQEFQVIYGVDNMSHNVHMCTHLDHVVRLLGPLWATSCFQFEDINGRLKNLIHGTRHVGLQIHSKLSLMTSLPLMVRQLREGPAKIYCDNLRRKYRLKVADIISPGVYCVGSLSDISHDYVWIFAVLRERELLSPNCKIFMFDRLLKDRLLYVSANYNRGERDSSYCKYQVESSCKSGHIKFFVKVSCACVQKCSCSFPTKYMAIIKPVPVVPFQTESVTVHHIFKVDASHVQEEFFNVDVVDIYDLKTVLYKLDCLDIVYLAEPLNKFELE